MQRRDNGMGTIYQRDNRTWIGRIKEKGKDGKTKYKCFSGKSQSRYFQMAAFHMKIILRRGSVIFYPENHGNDIAASRCPCDKMYLLFTAG